jgi:hypothetical protein
MRFYLKWLNKYERRDDENEPLERRKSLPKGKAQKQLDYFYDSKDDDNEDK